MKNTLHAFRKIVGETGVRGLWRGCVPNVQRAALVNLGGLKNSNLACMHSALYYQKYFFVLPVNILLNILCIVDGWAFNFFLALDLTTYDTAKQQILRHTSMKDDHVTHALSRYSTC